ncbi:opioid growth factor receptor-like isoform X1 [Seriola aureovittata]|uniref:opioid growth factor receptor-like isoform X1 n=1 Tax=Seriola aureovittata TaxID=2871759 RepID=UPI0024BDDF5C|nr:opioid growth factor receptor-like isoform X1 [Seriola aureovittata]
MSPLLLGLSGQVVLKMIWFAYNRARCLIEWLWRITRGFFLCCFTRVFTPIARYVLSAIGWREEHGSRNEPEVNDENKPQTTGSQDDRVEEPVGQWEAGRLTAGFDRKAEEREEEDAEEEEDEFDQEEYQVDPSDELYCGYDSTWETGEDQSSTHRRGRRPGASRHQYKFSRFENASRDMQNYRHDYPSQIRRQPWNQNMSSDDKPNLGFYLGNNPSLPDGLYIHNFHNDWKGEYNTLECVHTFIQWLFPLQEPGMNHEASTLTKEEIKEFLKSSTAKENLLKSYELMLDFYGIELCDKETGEVKRASNWRQRFSNLNNHTHNNLRITRILKCLGTLGYPHYQAPLVHFFLEETLVHGELPNVKESVLNFFVFSVLDKKQRRKLIKFAYLNYDAKDEFVWCPRKIQILWSEPHRGVHGRKDGFEHYPDQKQYQI